jgi:triacylglycerol esterase/lipase EstA (alpha/beta hydrolase family)
MCYPTILFQQYLGNHTEIVLLGHSRGGLAARSFMQGGYENKNSVLSMITTNGLTSPNVLLW